MENPHGLQGPMLVPQGTADTYPLQKILHNKKLKRMVVNQQRMQGPMTLYDGLCQFHKCNALEKEILDCQPL